MRKEDDVGGRARVTRDEERGHAMCGSMTDIQSATPVIRRGKKIEEDR